MKLLEQAEMILGKMNVPPLPTDNFDLIGVRLLLLELSKRVDELESYSYPDSLLNRPKMAKIIPRDTYPCEDCKGTGRGHKILTSNPPQATNCDICKGKGYVPYNWKEQILTTGIQITPQQWV